MKNDKRCLLVALIHQPADRGVGSIARSGASGIDPEIADKLRSFRGRQSLSRSSVTATIT